MKQEQIETELARLAPILDSRALAIVDHDGLEIASYGEDTDFFSLAPLAVELGTTGIHHPAWLQWIAPGSSWLHLERLPACDDILYLVTIGGAPSRLEDRRKLAQLLDCQ